MADLKKPMLAASGNTTREELERHFKTRGTPMILSPKVDGFRGVVPNGLLLSRKFIEIPNRFVHKRFSRPEFDGLDGELILGAPAGEGVMDRSGRACGNRSGEPDVKLYVFDCFRHKLDPYLKRLELTRELVATYHEHLRLVFQHVCYSLEDVLKFEDAAVKMKFEGVIGRSLNGPYKEGRSSGLYGDGLMFKIKREETAEALILKVNQGESNMNPAMLDNLGHTKRSTHQAGKVKRDTAGSFHCVMLNGRFKGVEFDCGLGTDSEGAEKIWKERDLIEGKLVITVKYYPYGAKDKPKSARCVAPRPDWDFDQEAA